MARVGGRLVPAQHGDEIRHRRIHTGLVLGAHQIQQQPPPDGESEPDERRLDAPREALDLFHDREEQPLPGPEVMQEDAVARPDRVGDLSQRPPTQALIARGADESVEEVLTPLKIRRSRHFLVAAQPDA